MLYKSMLHNILMYVTPCYITRACYVSCYKTCNTTASVYCCIVAGHATSIVVHPPSPEASESEHGGGSTGVPEWQLLDWDDYDFPDCMNFFFSPANLHFSPLIFKFSPPTHFFRQPPYTFVAFCHCVMFARGRQSL